MSSVKSGAPLGPNLNKHPEEIKVSNPGRKATSVSAPKRGTPHQIRMLRLTVDGIA